MKITILDETGHTEQELDTKPAVKLLARKLLDGLTVLVWPAPGLTVGVKPGMPDAETAVVVHTVKEIKAFRPVAALVMHPVAGG